MNSNNVSLDQEIGILNICVEIHQMSTETYVTKGLGYHQGIYHHQKP
jgi:hypothetical protein